MMAFESTTKRPTNDLATSPVKPKKRKVEFSDEVTLHPVSNGDDKEETFSTTMYSRFVKSALDDLENVC